MPRPAEIDRKQALKQARDVFWRQGYTATSMSQLLQVMGIGSGSFYAAFDSKARLFMLVVDDYAEWSMGQFSRVRARHRGLEVVRVFLRRTLVEVSASERRKGCLLVNSVLELDGVDQALQAHASTALGQMRSVIRECVEEAAAAEALDSAVSVSDATALVLNLIHGLRVDSRMGLSGPDAERRVSALVNVLSAKPTRACSH